MATSHKVYNSHGKKYKVPRKLVSSITELQRGDHIAFHRLIGVLWHHAIVEHINIERGEICIIEYTNTAKEFLNENCSPPTIKDKTIAKVVRGKIKFKNEKVYLMEHECCLDPHRVVLRAQSKLGEGNYNPFYNNCEHFAMWCKTGEASSDQINKAKEMIFEKVGVTSSEGLLTDEGKKVFLKVCKELDAAGAQKRVLENLRKALTGKVPFSEVLTWLQVSFSPTTGDLHMTIFPEVQGRLMMENFFRPEVLKPTSFSPIEVVQEIARRAFRGESETTLKFGKEFIAKAAFQGGSASATSKLGEEFTKSAFLGGSASATSKLGEEFTKSAFLGGSASATSKLGEEFTKSAFLGGSASATSKLGEEFTKSAFLGGSASATSKLGEEFTKSAFLGGSASATSKLGEEFTKSAFLGGSASATSKLGEEFTKSAFLGGSASATSKMGEEFTKSAFLGGSASATSKLGEEFTKSAFLGGSASATSKLGEEFTKSAFLGGSASATSKLGEEFTKSAFLGGSASATSKMGEEFTKSAFLGGSASATSKMGEEVTKTALQEGSAAATKLGEEVTKTAFQEGSEEVLTQSVSKGNSLLSGALFSVAVESAFAAYDIGCAYNDMTKGKINGTECATAAAKRIVTGTGNVVGSTVGASTVGAAIGQMLNIPFPIVGGVVGSVVGGVVGGLTGKFFGNLFANALL